VDGKDGRLPRRRPSFHWRNSVYCAVVQQSLSERNDASGSKLKMPSVSTASKRRRGELNAVESCVTMLVDAKYCSTRCSPSFSGVCGGDSGASAVSSSSDCCRSAGSRRDDEVEVREAASVWVDDDRLTSVPSDGARAAVSRGARSLCPSPAAFAPSAASPAGAPCC
jgi:hypothetical protein